MCPLWFGTSSGYILLWRKKTQLNHKTNMLTQGGSVFFRIMLTIIPLRLAICLALPVPSQDFFFCWHCSPCACEVKTCFSTCSICSLFSFYGGPCVAFKQPGAECLDAHPAHPWPIRFLCGRFPKLKGPEWEAAWTVQQSKLLKHWAKMRLCVCCELLCNLTQWSQSTKLTKTAEQNLHLISRSHEDTPRLRLAPKLRKAFVSKSLQTIFLHKKWCVPKWYGCQCSSLVPVTTLRNSLFLSEEGGKNIENLFLTISHGLEIA